MSRKQKPYNKLEKEKSGGDICNLVPLKPRHQNSPKIPFLLKEEKRDII